MAAAATPTLFAYPNGRRVYLNGISLRGSLSISQGTYTANGIPFTLAGVDGCLPADVSIGFSIGFAYSAGSGYIYELDPVHQTLRIFATGTASGDPLNELVSAANVPAGVYGDTVYFEADYNRGT